jgi:hypothetical protein
MYWKTPPPSLGWGAKKYQPMSFRGKNMKRWKRKKRKNEENEENEENMKKTEKRQKGETEV